MMTRIGTGILTIGLYQLTEILLHTEASILSGVASSLLGSVLVSIAIMMEKSER